MEHKVHHQVNSHAVPSGFICWKKHGNWAPFQYLLCACHLTHRVWHSNHTTKSPWNLERALILWSIFPPFLNRTWSWNTMLGFPVAGRLLTTMNSLWFADIILADGWQLSWLTSAFHVCQVLFSLLHPIFTSPWISTTSSIIMLLDRMFLNPWRMAAHREKVFLRTASYGKFILPFWAHIFTICAVLRSETCLRSLVT